ncbi:amphi-Trp domain-containing protein [Natranaeroarchaeum aerophilus]|uniref:Amphi-Trp domain-containing protein n=1 Tax=Natranaeroarchaeum aerophilus TaxID=2917711 RepID=A0AAE3K4L1_9EURY|nr:amphi-Trp domain-containing protein [Natranaeroarchaeum aerophilus]MCL9813343.1 amphi-Trp domain-containing protein [Natranaeroarchaeum aerophilus]
MSREIEFERDTSRDEVANQLEAFAERLRGDEPIRITIEERSFTVDPPETVEFEIEVDDEGETIGEDVERSIELEIEWETREGEEELPE